MQSQEGGQDEGQQRNDQCNDQQPNRGAQAANSGAGRKLFLFPMLFLYFGNLWPDGELNGGARLDWVFLHFVFALPAKNQFAPQFASAFDAVHKPHLPKYDCFYCTTIFPCRKEGNGEKFRGKREYGDRIIDFR